MASALTPHDQGGHGGIAHLLQHGLLSFRKFSRRLIGTPSTLLNWDRPMMMAAALVLQEQCHHGHPP